MSYRFSILLLVCSFVTTSVRAQPPPNLEVQLYPGITVTGKVGVEYAIQATTNPAVTNTWVTLKSVTLPESPWRFIDYDSRGTAKRFYRAVDLGITNMVLIPEGSFRMGNSFCANPVGCTETASAIWELPAHTVYVSAFYMDKTEVTKALWDDVYQWATNHGYSFDRGGSGKATNHPIHSIYWYDAAKWCNARSEKEQRTPAYYTSLARTTPYRGGKIDLQEAFVKWDAGYRLPTEAEWEKAARGGSSGHRFPWAETDTISHNHGNYSSDSSYAYDISSTRRFHPAFAIDPQPYTSPAGYFAENGFGLQDMAGNVWEFCWDRYGELYYGSSTAIDPHGPASGELRVWRGGSWSSSAESCRASDRKYSGPDNPNFNTGFRTVLPPSQ